MTAPSRFQIRIGGQWKDYAHDEDKILKMLFKQGRKTATVTLRGQDYEYDFIAFKQRNLSTGKVRGIRLPKEWMDAGGDISRATSSRSGGSGVSPERGSSARSMDVLLTVASPVERAPPAAPPAPEAALSPPAGTVAQPGPDISDRGAPRTSPPLPSAPQTTILQKPLESAMGLPAHSPSASPTGEGVSASRVQSSRPAVLLPEAPHGTIARILAPEAPQPAVSPVPVATQQSAPPSEKGQGLPEAPLTILVRSIARGASSWLPSAFTRSQAVEVSAETGAGNVDAAPAARVPVDTLRAAQQIRGARPQPEVPPTVKDASLEASRTINEASLAPEFAAKAFPIPEKTSPLRTMPNTTLPLTPSLMKAANQAAAGEQLRLPVATVKARVPLAATRAAPVAVGTQPSAAQGLPMHMLPMQTLRLDMAKVVIPGVQEALRA